MVWGERFEVVNIVEHVHVGPTVDNLLCLCQDCVELWICQHVVFQQALQHFFYEPYHTFPNATHVRCLGWIKFPFNLQPGREVGDGRLVEFGDDFFQLG